MKKLILITLIFVTCVSNVFSQAQRNIRAYNNGNAIYQVSVNDVDTISFPNSTVRFKTISSVWSQPISEIDSLVFVTVGSSSGDTTSIDTTNGAIYIIYNGTSAPTIINPYSSQGVSITTSGADVTVNSTIATEDLVYHLSGTTTSGSLLITTSKKLILMCNGVSITNPNGPALKIASDKRATLHLVANTTSNFTDGTANTDKAAVQTAGKFIIQGSGIMRVSGLAKHGIQSSGSTKMLNGEVRVLSAVKDGMNVDNFIMDGGTLYVTSSGDGIDGDQGYIEINNGIVNVTCSAVDSKGICCDSTLTINGGSVTVVSSGNQSKAIKTKSTMTVYGGTLDVTASGTVVLETSGSGYDPSYCTAIKALDYIGIGGNVTINCPSSNAGGKGISADSTCQISGGTYNITVNGNGATYTDENGQSDMYSSTCIKADKIVNISSGTMTLTNTGSNGRGISCDGNIIFNTGCDLTATMSGAQSKGIKVDDNLNVNGGTIDITASGTTYISNGDTSYCSAIKVDGNANFAGGDLTLTCPSTNNGGRGISVSGVLNITGGTMNLSTAGSGVGSSTRGFSPACIKADANAFITGGNIYCNSTGKGGRGIKVDGRLTIGTLNAADSLLTITVLTSGNNVVTSGSGGGGSQPGGSSSSSYTGVAKGIKAIGSIIVNSGTVRIYCSQTSTSSTAEGMESKDTIFIKGGNVEANTYDDAINAAKWMNISGGRVWAYSRGNDAIDCNGTNITLSGGLIIAKSSSEQAIDVNLGETQGNTLTISGATVCAMGGSMGTFSNSDRTAPTMLNNQKYLKTTYTIGNTLVIKNSSSQNVLVWKYPTVSGNGFNAGTSKNGTKPPGGGGGGGGTGGGSTSGNFIFTSPSVSSGTYSAYTSATISGGSNWHGYYTNSTASTSGNSTNLTAQ